MKINPQIITAVLLVLFVVASVAGAWQLGFQQHQECASGWYWTGWNVGSGKEVE